MLSKSFEQIDSSVPVEVYDIDESSDVAFDYGVRSVPTMIMLDGNIEIKRTSGTMSPSDLQQWLTSH